MVLDTISQGARYVSLHPAFGKAFAFLRRQDLGSLAEGRHEIDGEALYALVMDVTGRGREQAVLEVHRRYIDIQVTVRGEEVIGWRPLAACEQSRGFDAEKDVGFFSDACDVWVTVPAGCFAVFHPDDGHAPLAGAGPIRKVVVKVAVA
ncbi:MAG: YhcH/YjgK/YiaL family protein [Lentisphaeria bacterium]|nr:YhcH/YjgK/YiaL family protein [Lentisphaeria bacterium]